MDLTFYYPELARWACADPTRVWLETSMDQFMFKHLISAVAASIKQTAAWFLLLVWSCTLAGSAEAAFLNHTGTMMQGQEMVWVSLRRAAPLNVLLFRSSVQSLSYGESVRCAWVWVSETPMEPFLPERKSPVWRSERAELWLVEGADGDLFVVDSSIINSEQDCHLYCGILTQVRDSGNQNAIA